MCTPVIAYPVSCAVGRTETEPRGSDTTLFAIVSGTKAVYVL